MLSKQIEKAQKKVEEQNFLIRKRVLEYDDVMNEQRRVIYAYRDEVLEGKSIGEEARREVASVIERTVEQYTPGRLHRGLGHRRPVHRARAVLPARPRRARTSIAETVDRIALDRSHRASCARALRRARGGTRRGADGRARALPAAADHRRTLARAPVRHGLPARRDPPARLRPDRSAGRLQERGLHAVRRPHEQRLDRLRAHDLQRPGQRRGRERRRPPARRAFAASGNSTRAGRVSYSGGHSAAGAGAHRGRRGRRRPGAAQALRRREAERKRCRWSSSGCSTTSTRSGATTPAGAGAARSSRSATAPSAPLDPTLR